MLSSLHIRNYILIDSLDISFPEGLIIVTGQTGAGKSILLGALSLLSGTKADSSMIAQGADNCVVEAEFDSVPAEVETILQRQDVDCEPNHVIIRRTVSCNGRSRCFVNDCPVQVGILQEISAHLFDIHSQHRSLLLCDRSFQLRVLDFFAGNTDSLAECRKLFRTLSSKRRELSEVEREISDVRSRADYDTAQLAELRAARLCQGELESLESEQKMLSNAEQIKENLATCSELFDPSSDDRQGVSSSLREARRLLEKLEAFLPEAASLGQRLYSASMEIEDIASEVEGINSSVSLSSERLGAVESRLSLLYSLMKKHSCRTVEDLVRLRDEYEKRSTGLEDLQEKSAALSHEISILEARYDSVCDNLSSARRRAVPAFCTDVLSSLSSLELEGSRFEVSLSECPPSENGKDAVCFLFSANNTPPSDLASCSSGGEMSRIMLSLKANMARFTYMPTLIFDEIDTGVSGSVADKMGRMICSMGEEMQVIAITHLPQVAAKGKAHYVVVKNTVDGKVVSTIRRVAGKERENEIARLLSGSDITDAALANARELLKG